MGRKVSTCVCRLDTIVVDLSWPIPNRYHHWCCVWVYGFPRQTFSSNEHQSNLSIARAAVSAFHLIGG